MGVVLELFRGAACSSAPRTAQTIFEARHWRSSRFWPVKCGDINLDTVAVDRDQLLAEAVALFAAGSPWWPQTDEERALCGTEQAERYDEDIWHQKIAAFARDEGGGAHRTRCSPSLGSKWRGMGGRKRQACRRRNVAARLGAGA